MTALAAAGRDLQARGHVRIVERTDRAIVGWVASDAAGREHLVTVVGADARGDRTGRERLSSCTCAAGRHDRMCRHVHALLWEAFR